MRLVLPTNSADNTCGGICVHTYQRKLVTEPTTPFPVPLWFHELHRKPGSPHLLLIPASGGSERWTLPGAINSLVPQDITAQVMNEVGIHVIRCGARERFVDKHSEGRILSLYHCRWEVPAIKPTHPHYWYPLNGGEQRISLTSVASLMIDLSIKRQRLHQQRA